jgi:HD-GYP domain-containing protein (c-di-GMP phosphodiesterase class II)
MAHGIGWNSELSRNKLGLASLVHDCFLPHEQMSRIQSLDHPDLERYSEEDKLAFKAHPAKAASLSLQFSGFVDAEFLLTEHQELPDGSGFPRGLNHSRLTPISSLFILASNLSVQLAILGISRQTLHAVISGYANLYTMGNFREPYKALKKDLKGF